MVFAYSCSYPSKFEVQKVGRILILNNNNNTSSITVQCAYNEERNTLLSRSCSPSLSIVNISYLVRSSGMGCSRFHWPQANSKKSLHGSTVWSADWRMRAA